MSFRIPRGRQPRSLPRLRLFVSIMAVFFLVCPVPAGAYSVLSHEEVVDLAWKPQIVPMLEQRFPGITPDQIRQAHAYAYGGSVIQDIGYYPFGSHYFSDLLHYVRPNDFVTALIRDSRTPNEYAFALGALAHFCGDTLGHPVINQVTALENARLARRYGPVVTYDEDPVAHVRTEFGFDVVEVAHGLYSQQNYHDFIGFQVARPLLEQAFLETYGLPMNSVIKNEDIAIGAYRKAVASLLPEVTRIGYVTYRKEIEKAAPGTAKRTFLYRINQTQYHREFGNVHPEVSFGGRVLAFFLRLLPRIGPFKALKVSIPNPAEQDLYLQSVNAVVDQYRIDLAQIHAAPAPLPPITEADARDARNAADFLKDAAARDQKLADHTRDPAERERREKQAAGEQQLATRAAAVAAQVEAQATVPQSSAVASQRSATATDQLTPTTPNLPNLDLDTGKPSTAGEYPLADQTYARLLDDLVHAHPAAGTASPVPTAISSANASLPFNPVIVTDIQRFFAHPITSAQALTPRQTQQATDLAQKVKADLALLPTN